MTFLVSSSKKSHGRVRIENWNLKLFFLTMEESDISYHQRAETIHICAKLICQQFFYKNFACYRDHTRCQNRIDIATSSYLA